MGSDFVNTSVLFVSMPFAPLLTPSLGLSLLKAKLAVDGITSEILYFGIDFARQIGPIIYSKIESGAPANHDLAGEWIFSRAVCPQAESAANNYVREILRGEHPAHNKTANNQREFPEEFFDELLRIRGQVTAFLDECLEQVIVRKPRLIGFTTVFQQNLASLALALRIRERLPGTFLVFGGANCEGIMGRELLRQFPFVDAVVSGPGEMVITQLVKHTLEDRSVAGIPGVLVCQDVAAKGPVYNAQQIPRMDDLPVPDFDDYFTQLKDAEMDLPIQPRLLFETSRGCWWGQKHHCTFCGLNGQSMNHRSKSAARALYELEELARRYPGLQISVVDNILDMHYFKDFLPSLAKRNAISLDKQNGLGLELFYEVKANLKKAQLRLLRDAGVTQIQPGIESFSDAVLQLMRKGVRAIQNIQLLKWCKELGILPSWNILWGFPGEPSTDYLRMAELVPLLSHLPPPSSASPIRLDRFSPNFEAPDEHGFRNVRPYPSYYYVYPLSEEAIHNLAYFFVYDRMDQADSQAYTAPLMQRIAEWQDGYDQTDFFSIEVGPWLILWDFRPVASAPLITLSGLARLLYLKCDQACTVAQLQDIATAQYSDRSGVEPLLQAMCERSLMLQDNGCYLSLAVPVGNYTPTATVLQRLEQALIMIGKRSNTAGVTSIDCRDYALTLA
jgi:ribosomal peptide maturation radical SAM protein 1